MKTKNIIPAVLFLLLAVLFSRILLINPNVQLIGDGGDNYEYFGYMHFANQNIARFQHPFTHINTLRYPTGFNFSYGHDGSLLVLLGALLAFFVSLPLAYNLVVIANLWLNLFVAFIIFRKILSYCDESQSNINIAAFIAALIDAWSPFVFAHINGQLNLSLTIGFPVLWFSIINLYFKVKTNTSIKLIDFLYIPLGILLISLASVQYILITGQVIAVVAVYALWTLLVQKNKKQIIKSLMNFLNQEKLKIIISLAFLVIPFLYFHGSYIQAILTRQFVFTNVAIGNPQIQPKISDLFVPNAYLGSWWKYINPSEELIEKPVGFGIIGWFVILGYIIFGKTRKPKIKILVLLLLLFLSIFIFKPFLVPESVRMWPLLSFPIILILSFQLKRLPKSILVYLLILLLLERMAFLIRISPPFPQQAAEIVRNQPGKAVFHIPLLTTQGYHSALSYFWDKSIVDGYFLHIANTPNTNSFLKDPDINKFFCTLQPQPITINDTLIQTILNKLKANDISTIVLIKEGANDDLWWFKECAAVRQLWQAINPEQAIADKNRIIEHKFTFGRGAPINARLLFNQTGRVRLERISIGPPIIDDLSIATSGSNFTRLKWNSTSENGDLIYDYFPRMFINVNPGDSIRLISEKVSTANSYVNIYYLYTPTFTLNQNQIRSSSYLKLLWKNDQIEIYSIR